MFLLFPRLIDCVVIVIIYCHDTKLTLTTKFVQSMMQWTLNDIQVTINKIVKLDATVEVGKTIILSNNN